MRNHTNISSSSSVVVSGDTQKSADDSVKWFIIICWLARRGLIDFVSTPSPHENKTEQKF